MKTYIQSPGGQIWAVTLGEGSDVNSLHIGFVDYIPNKEYIIYQWGHDFRPVGILTASDYIDAGIHYLEVEISLNENNNHDDILWLFTKSFLYVGSEEGYLNNYLTTGADGTVYTGYENFPYQEDETSVTRIFKIPFNDIDE